MQNKIGDSAKEFWESRSKVRVRSLEDPLIKILENHKSAYDFIEFLCPQVKVDYEIHDTGVSSNRTAHSVATYTQGLIFENFNDFKNQFQNALEGEASSIVDPDESLNQELWLLTSLNHDRGYLNINALKNPNYSRRGMAKKDLFCDSDDFPFSTIYTRVLAYNYDELLGYEKYAVEYHSKNNDDEKYDHGFLGAALTYNELMKGKSNDLDRRSHVIAKTVALTIAQHNIFKSSSVSSDLEYRKYKLERLCSDSLYKIGMNTPLLMFLDLVDTLEFIKRFGEKRKNSTDKYSPFITINKLLSLVQIEVTKEKIVLDLSKLYEYIIEKRIDADKTVPFSLMNRYESYVNGIMGLPKWTWFNSKKEKDKEIYIITMDIPSED